MNKTAYCSTTECSGYNLATSYEQIALPKQTTVNSEIVLDHIRRWLAENDVKCQFKKHVATFTSEESAAARGEPLEIGGKALLLKAESGFVLCVLPASTKLDSGAIKRELGVKKLRFASPDELLQHTGLVPGSVPPFGHPILPFPLYVEERVFDQDRIAFNAGSLTTSVVMSTKDYHRIANAKKIGRFARIDSPAIKEQDSNR